MLLQNVDGISELARNNGYYKVIETRLYYPIVFAVFRDKNIPLYALSIPLFLVSLLKVGLSSQRKKENPVLRSL